MNLEASGPAQHDLLGSATLTPRTRSLTQPRRQTPDSPWRAQREILRLAIPLSVAEVRETPGLGAVLLGQVLLPADRKA